MRRRCAIDLFGGAGGTALGLRMAGYDVLASVELDAVAAESFAQNHPATELLHNDIRNISPLRIARQFGLRAGDVDLLSACPPCQGFSSLRTLNGHRTIHDEQNDLIFEVARFAKALLPNVVMLENVPGLASDARLETLSGRLHQLGYRTSWSVLDAQYFGVPQRRKRLVLFAYRDHHGPKVRQSKKIRTVREAFSVLGSSRSDDDLQEYDESRSARVRKLIAGIPKNGGSRIDLPSSATLACHKRCDGFFDVYGRMSWDKPAPTITAGCINPSKGRFLHPAHNRAINLREAALLQGFPPTYYFSLSRGRYKAAELIGNAFPPPLAYACAKAVRRAEGV